MSGKNIIMSRKIPVQQNDPAVLQTLLNKSVVRYVDGKITDYSGTNIDPYEFTLANFLTLNPADYAGIEVRVTDLHATSAGVGGVRFIGGTSWILQSRQIYWATYSAALAAIAGWTTVSKSSLVARIGDLGANGVTLVHNGTKFVPNDGGVLLASATYGDLTTPTKNSGTGTTTYSFNIGSPSLPANLFSATSKLMFKGKFQRHNGGAPAAIVMSFRLGTDNAPTDSPMYSASISSAGSFQVNGDSFVEFVTTGKFLTNLNASQAGSGSAGAISERTAGLDTTAIMYLSCDITSKASADTLDLISWSLYWME